MTTMTTIKSTTQSKPAKEHWIDLAKQSGHIGREDCQEGWHQLASILLPPPLTILDVGAGLCLSAKRLGHFRLTTQDPAPDLPADIKTPVEDIPDQSYDAVTCFDVIEHVVDDISFLNHLKRIARRYVFITTPNYNISKAVNGCHCREYTPKEFLELTRGIGRRLWTGDGQGLNTTTINGFNFPFHKQPHHAVLLDVTRGNYERWYPWYHHLPENHPPTPYGNTDAYQLSADYLRNCKTVEDWGCGMGYFRTYLPGKVVGIDGTASPHMNIKADLAHYLSSPDGIFMRGVIEHDRRWKDILYNATVSFKERMVLVLFTPLSTETKEIDFNEEIGVPDISFSLKDLIPFFNGFQWSCQTIQSDTAYDMEVIFYIQR